MKLKSQALRAISLVLSFALIQASFGPEAAWAQAQNVPLVPDVPAPVGGGGSAAAAADSRALANDGTLQMPTAPMTGAPAASSQFIAAPPSAVPSRPLAAMKAAAPAFAASDPARQERSAGAGLENEAAAKAPTETPATETRLESGPQTKRVVSRMARRFAELKNFFGGRKSVEPAAGAVPIKTAAEVSESSLRSAGTAALSQRAAAAQVPSPNDASSATKKRSISWFLGGMVVAQIGVEILGLAMPLLMRSKFGGFSALAQIAVFSSAASIFGQLGGGPIAGKIGIKAAFVGATILRLLSITAMVVFLMGPHAPLIAAFAPLAKFSALLNGFSSRAALMAFYSFNGFMAGVAGTAQKSIPTAIMGNDRATLEKFYSLQQWTLETIGVTGPKAGGIMVQTFGFTSAIAVYPVMLAVAVAMYIFGVRLPDGASADGASAAPASKFAAVLAPLAPMNRAISGAFRRISGAIVKAMDGLVLKAYLGRWIAKMGGKGNLTDADENALLTRSTLGWTTAGMLSLAGFATLLLPTALPAYAAMIVFGVAEVIASQKLYSLILSRAKDKAETVKINAVAGGVFTAVSALALNVAGALFDKTAGMTPFVVFTAALLPLGAAVFFIRRMLKKTADADAPMTGNRPNGYKLLLKDPMMRWAFLGYVALGVTNPLLYQILSQAYGLLHAGGNAALASGAASWITALYSLGGLLGALYMWRESTLISDAKKSPEASTKKK